MTTIDCKAIFNLQTEILESPDLTDAQKIKMLKASIAKTLGNKKEEEEK
jgi:hypothetical protein